MNLKEYQELAGKTISDSEKKTVEAQIRKSQRILESMLGFTLDPIKTTENLYNELGKTRTETSCSNVDTSLLLPPDEVFGAYRLYKYNDLDKFFHIDPFTNVYNVKLVYIRTGLQEEESITLKTFSKNEVRPQYGRDGIGKYIEKIDHHWRFLGCNYEPFHVQLAVDADWLFTPEQKREIKDLLVDMVSAQLDPYNNVRSESIDGHSYTKFDKISPETDKHNLDMLKRYAGPYGSLSKKV